MEQKPNYYAVIPLYILEAKDLRPNAKLLYAEITSLTRKDGVCKATNAYLAERLGIKNKRSTIVLLRQLEKAGHIKTRTKWIKGGTWRDIVLTPSLNNDEGVIKQRKPRHQTMTPKESISKNINKSGATRTHLGKTQNQELKKLGIYPL